MTRVKTISVHVVLEIAEGDILDILVYDEDLADHDIVGLSRQVITSGLLAKKQLDLSFGRVEQLRLELRPHTRTPAPAR